MGIYVNRVLNMKHIKVIGFDMDHTLVRYNSDKFEKLTFHESLKKLISEKDYPKEISQFQFDFNRAIRGLIVDKVNGNILKVSAQLVDLKDAKPELNLPEYANMADDVTFSVDLAHRDGSLKNTVKENLAEYVIKDQQIVEVLERFKKYDKKLWIVTNSDYNYTKALLDYTINPFLKDHKDWQELFEITVTLASKPRFFTEKMPTLKVDPKTALMENYDVKLVPGVYQGGYATKLQEDFELQGDQILYLGDHIYGDIVKLKKACGWRTALVIEELDREVKAYKSTKEISIEIDQLMQEKISLENQIDELYAKEHEYRQKVEKNDVFAKFNDIEKIDKKIAGLIKTYESNFNPNWGEVMRAGVEPSVYASQIERYACIYMTKISDFSQYNPRKYYRPKKRKIAHER